MWKTEEGVNVSDGGQSVVKTEQRREEEEEEAGADQGPLIPT